MAKGGATFQVVTTLSARETTVKVSEDSKSTSLIGLVMKLKYGTATQGLGVGHTYKLAIQ